MDPGEGAALLAHGGVYGVFGAAIAVTGLVTCFRARRGKDPARLATVWLRALFAFTFLEFVLGLCGSVLNGLTWIIDYDYDDGIFEYYSRVATATNVTSGVFSGIAKICFIMTCIELGNGFVYALERQQTSQQKILRTLGLVSIAVLFILTLVHGGMLGAMWDRYYDAQYSGSSSYSRVDGIISQLNQLNDLNMAILVITLAIDIAILVQASVVKSKYRLIETSRQTVTLYLVATVLAVPRALYSVAYAGVSTYGDGYSASRPVIYVPTNIVFSIIPWFIMLILLFCVGIRRHNGLWTVEQPWMNGVPPVLAQRQQQAWYGQQPVMYQQGGVYPPPNTVMYQPQPQHVQYAWQPQQQPDPSKVPGASPVEAPHVEQPQMLPASPHLRHEMHAQ